jgi:hypothetical protein
MFCCVSPETEAETPYNDHDLEEKVREEQSS